MPFQLGPPQERRGHVSDIVTLDASEGVPTTQLQAPPLAQLRTMKKRVGRFVQNRVAAVRSNVAKLAEQHSRGRNTAKTSDELSGHDTPHRARLCLASLSADATVPTFLVKDADSGYSSHARSNHVVTVASAAEDDQEMSAARKALSYMLAGGIAGAVVETSLYPIDTIKTRLQAARAGQGFRWGGLYKGLPGNICGVFPYVAPVTCAAQLPSRRELAHTSELQPAST